MILFSLVKKWLENSPLTAVAISSIEMQYLLSLILILKSLIKCETEMYKNNLSYPCWTGSDRSSWSGYTTGSDETKIAYGTPVLDAIKALQDNGQLSDNSWITSGIRAQEYDSYYADNGSLLFIGIFLGSLFLSRYKR